MDEMGVSNSGYRFLGPDMEAVTEIISDRLYFVTYKKKDFTRVDKDCHYFNIDQQLIYANYFCDFGPLNLAQLYRYWLILREKLGCPSLHGKRIVHWTTTDFKKRANSAFLMGCFAVIYLNMSPHHVHRLLLSGISKYRIKLIDCFCVISKACQLGFFNFEDFDLTHYEHYEKAQNGDLNWIVPEKLLAFSGPTSSEMLGCSPESYLPYFKMAKIRNIVRLNKPNYSESKFTSTGIVIHDLFFTDGSVPSKNIVYKFLALTEGTEGPIAVHCKAGLGRTGCLIGAYLIKHYEMTALEAIAWMRICRPGCVIGHQQAWLERMQHYLHRSGHLYRLRVHGDISKVPCHTHGIYSISMKKQSGHSVGSSFTAGDTSGSEGRIKERKTKSRTLQSLVKLGERKKKKLVKFPSENPIGSDGASDDISGTKQGDSLRMRKWEIARRDATPSAEEKPLKSPLTLTTKSWERKKKLVKFPSENPIGSDGASSDISGTMQGDSLRSRMWEIARRDATPSAEEKPLKSPLTLTTKSCKHSSSPSKLLHRKPLKKINTKR